MLSIRNLTREFHKPDAIALSDVSFELNAGDICGVVGHRNSGRTTLLNIIAGFLPFNAGEVFVDGKSLKDDPKGCQAVTAYVPETPGYVRTISVLQYLNFMADMYGLTREEREERITRWAAEFKLTAVLPEYICDISDAYRYRLGVVGALIRQPKLLVMEHPFDRPDHEGDVILEGVLRRLSEEGTTVVFTSSHLKPLEKLCSKMLQLSDGKVTVFGDVKEIAGEDGKLFNDISGIERITTKKKLTTNPYSSDEDKPEYDAALYFSRNGEEARDYNVPVKKRRRVAPEGMAEVRWWHLALQWLLLAGTANLSVFSLNSSGQGNLILPLLPVAALISAFVFTFMQASAVLFGHSIFGKTRSLAVRVLKTALLNVLLSATVMVPGLVLLVMNNPAYMSDPLFWGTAAVGVPGLPMISMTAALLCGGIYTAIRFRINNPWILSSVLSVSAMALSLCFRVVRSFATIDSIKELALNILDTVQHSNSLSRLFIDGLTGASASSFWILAAVCALCFALPVCVALALPDVMWHLVVIPAVSPHSGSVTGLRTSSPSVALYKVEASYFLPNLSTYATIFFSIVGMVLIELMILTENKDAIDLTDPRRGVVLTIGVSTFYLSIYSVFSVLFIRPLYLRGEPWLMVSRSTATLQDIFKAKLRAFYSMALPVWALLSAILDLIINTIAVRGNIVLNLAERLQLPFNMLIIISSGALLFMLGAAVELNISRNASAPNPGVFFIYFFAMFTFPALFMIGAVYYGITVSGYVIYGLLALICLIIYAWLMSMDFKTLKDKLPRRSR